MKNIRNAGAFDCAAVERYGMLGDSQEMVAFITELNANYYSLWFIRENGSDQYYRHNKGLLFDNRQKQILGQMEELEQGNSLPPVLK